MGGPYAPPNELGQPFLRDMGLQAAFGAAIHAKANTFGGADGQVFMAVIPGVGRDNVVVEVKPGRPVEPVPTR